MPDAEQPNREKEIFERALEIASVEERVAFLKGACGEDLALFERIQALLRAAETAADFLPETPKGCGGTVRLNLPLSEKPGDRIGRYKLLQQIGEGGCGVVYMAEQEDPVRRRVALKIIKLGMDTKEVIGRFEAERQALALMDHPNIAKVLDAGATETGRPYFVMELVRGIKITDYCDQNNLSTAARLNLFVQVCHAVQHAHQKGIIHRDLKPSNILVTLNDGVPMPKVIDFGIAKATLGKLTDHTVFTAFEQFIGTPAYMSPEQAEMSALDIDTRSDIYSLGVLLYELLTGQTPFDAKELLQAGLDEMRRQIREVEPARPSTRLSTMMAADLTTVATHRQSVAPKLVHLIRGDLDWIVMKCLEKDRTRRYDTANGLALDLQRHLNNEPVTARSPGNLYQFQKLVRRNKLAFTAAASITLALLAGLGVSTWLFIKEKAARHAAETEASKSRQVAYFLQEMLEGVGPSVALGRDTKLLEEIMDKTSARLVELKDEPESEVELRSTIGRVYMDLGRYDKGEEMLRSELDLRRKLLGTNDPQLAPSLEDFGVILGRRGKFAESESVDREALALNRKFLGDENPETMIALGNLAIVLRDKGDLAESESLHREVLATRRKVQGDDNVDTITAMSNLASVLLIENKLAEAEDIYRATLAARKKMFGAENPKTAFSLVGLSSTLAREGKFAEAESCAREAIEIRRKVLGTNHPDYAVSLNDLGFLLDLQGKPAEAEPYFQEAVAIQRRVFGDEDRNIAISLGNLSAIVRDGRGDLVESESLGRQSVAMFTKTLGLKHLDTLKAIAILAATLRVEGKLAEAEATNRAALMICTNFITNQPARLAALLDGLGQTLGAENLPQEAEEKLRAALALRRKALAADNPELASSLFDLARELCRHHGYSEAQPLAAECLAIREKKAPTDWHTSATRSLLGECWLGQKDFKQAEPLLRAGYDDLNQRGATSPAAARRALNEARQRLIQLYESTQRSDEASKLAKP